MQFSEPVSSVVPGLHGRVLGVLVRAGQPLTGRGVAELLRSPASPSGVHKVLDDLVRNGVVTATPAGRARLYALNTDHVAYESIEQLGRLRELLVERIRSEAESWEMRAEAVWLFGSSARAQGDADSDLDVLVVRPDHVDDADPDWLGQLETLADHATRWSGNSCEVVEYSAVEIHDLIRRGERLITELRRDAVPVTGTTPRQLLTRKARR
jgi:predicted nucleotidyltransferase